MNEDIVKKAILTLEVLIDCCKEDGTSYTARKEWEALKVFKQLQNNWNELKEDIPYILEMIERNKDVIKVTSDEQLAIYSLQNKMQELEQGKDENN